MFVTDERSVVFQGPVVDDPRVVAGVGECAVALPGELLPEFAARRDSRHVRVSGSGEVIVVGPRVVDRDALACLALPPGEDAVVLAVADVPELAGEFVGC